MYAMISQAVDGRHVHKMRWLGKEEEEYNLSVYIFNKYDRHNIPNKSTRQTSKASRRGAEQIEDRIDKFKDTELKIHLLWLVRLIHLLPNY